MFEVNPLLVASDEYLGSMCETHFILFGARSHLGWDQQGERLGVFSVMQSLEFRQISVFWKFHVFLDMLKKV